MAKEVIYDSLLFGMKFGQSKEEFFRKCWKLNQKGLVSEGPGNNSVKYGLPYQKGDTTKSEITLLFYGIFNDENIISGMEFQFYYNAWSLWNKELQADKLIHAVKDTLKKWYPGNDFIKVPLKKNGMELFVKVDGNRRVIIKPLEDDKIVKAQIDDLRYVLDKD